MNLVAMSIPEDPVDLPGWLERQLVSLELGALVAELTAVHGAAEGPELTGVLGDRREAVLARGLAALPASALRQLLRQPRLLLDLQELVLTEGGPYWQHLPKADPLLATLALRDERLLVSEITPAPSLRITSATPKPRASWWRSAAVGLASAAAALLAVYLFRDPLARQVHGPPAADAATAWGWEKLGDPPPDLAPPAYLNELADAADEWFRQRPEEPAVLAQRIGEMRLGCSRLIFAPHTPLKDPAQREWLVARCRAWAAKFDKSLADLEAGRPVAEVRGDMDRTVQTLAGALRERAKSLTNT
jgi:hypothetical protein